MTTLTHPIRFGRHRGERRPAGVPRTDLIPILSLLDPTLSDAEAQRVAGVLAAESRATALPVTREGIIRALETYVFDEGSLWQDDPAVARVAEVLTASGVAVLDS